MTWLRELYKKSVFWHDGPYLHPNEVLAVLFHRSAATLYLIYTIWGILTIVFNLPTVSYALGHIPQLTFSSLVVITIGPACVGAAFFPRFARLELLASSSFVVLILIYEIIIFTSIIHDPTRWSSIFAIGSFFVIPTVRMIFIYLLLIKNAEGTPWWKL